LNAADVSRLQQLRDIDPIAVWAELPAIIERLQPEDPANITLPVMESLGRNLILRSYSDIALKFLPQAKLLAEKTQNTAARLNLELMLKVSQNYVAEQRFDEAEVKRLAQAITTTGDIQRQAEGLFLLATATSGVKLSAVRLQLIEQLKMLYQSHGELQAYDLEYLSLYAEVLQQAEEKERAVKVLEQALASAQKRASKWQESNVVYSLGQLYSAKKELAQARSNFMRAYDIGVALQDPQGIAFSAQQLALVDLQETPKPHYDSAERWVNIALPVFLTLEDPKYVAMCELIKANIALSRNDIAAAKTALNEVAAKRQTLREPDSAEYLTRLAKLQQLEGKYELAYLTETQANKLYQRANEISNLSNLSTLRSLLGLAELEKDKLTRTRQGEQQSNAKERHHLMSLIIALGTGLLVITATSAVLLYRRAMRFRSLSDTDALTGVLSRRAVELRFRSYINTNRYAENIFTLMVFDVDRFKQLNDDYGHAAGDKMLKEIVYTVQSVLRKDDVIGRLGGDEFGVILSGASVQTSCEIASKIAMAVRNIDHKRWPNWAPSVSIGLASHTAVSDSLSSLYAKADRALYHAKSNGRDQFCHTFELNEESFYHSELQPNTQA
jgi:diguanylate cyclase (GGDEF)-like protein